MNRFGVYVDEDAMRRGLAEGLVARGVDVLTAKEAGMVNRSDEDQLRFATQERRTVFTFNTGDFVRLHSRWLKEGRSHAGIIVATQRKFPIGEQIRRWP